jgi:hypothetical protein
MMLPKPPRPTRSRVYLDYVRSHACCNPTCGMPEPSEAHHYGPRGYGQKTDDHRTVPLCHGCHSAWHNKSTLPGFDRSEAIALMYRVQVDMLIAYFVRGEREAW